MEPRSRKAKRTRPPTELVPPRPACVYCKDSTGLIVKCGLRRYPAHISCRRQQLCCYCGGAGMNTDCDNSETRRVAHDWCRNRSVLPLSESIVALKSSVSAAVSDPELLSALRKHDLATNKAHRKSTGSVLWFYIGNTYFPAFTDVTAWPDPAQTRLSTEDQIALIDQFRKKSWPNSEQIDLEIDTLEHQLSQACAAIRSLQESAPVRTSRAAALRPFAASMSDSHFLLSELELLEFANPRSQFIAYVQRKQKNPTTPFPPCDLETPKKEYNCGVCLGGTSEDRNPIMICSSCDGSTHVRCYGLQTVPAEDWVCDVCKCYGKATVLPCALCPVSGGMMKETVHACEQGHRWCHVLCALFVPGVHISQKSCLPKVVYTLSDVGRNAYKKCEICGERTQAYVQCTAKACGFTFHPGCGKALLVSEWRRGPEVGEILCKLHKPLPVIKRIHDARKRKSMELVYFAKYWQDEGPIAAETLCKRARPWSSGEIEELEAAIQAKLVAASELLTKEFKLTISFRPKLTVRCSRPEGFNLISLDMMKSEGICLRNRSAEECATCYRDQLMDRMKKELALAETPVRIYAQPIKIDPEFIDEPIKKPKISEKKPATAKKSVRNFLWI